MVLNVLPAMDGSKMSQHEHCYWLHVMQIILKNIPSNSSFGRLVAFFIVGAFVYFPFVDHS